MKSKASESKTAFELIFKVALLGLGFSLVFTGYNVSQAFVTTLYHTQGFVALCLIYLMYGISSLIAPFVLDYAEYIGGSGHGEKLTMVISGLSYVFFISMVATGSTTLLILGSLIKGFGSGLLWISQGVWLNKMIKGYIALDSFENSEDIVGKVTSVFFILFNMNSVVGNLIVIFLMKSGYSLTAMVITMAIVTSFGTLTFLFISKPSAQLPNKQDSGSTKGKFSDLYQMACSQKSLLLTPYLFYQGVSMAYTYGNFPAFVQYISDRSQVYSGSSSAATMLAFCFLSYGVGGMIGSYLWGKIFDLFSGKLYPLLTTHLILVGVNFSLLISMILVPSFDEHTFFLGLLINGFIFGLIDFLSNSVINNTISKSFDSSEAPAAFSWYRFCFCLGFAGTSGISSVVPSLVSKNGLGGVLTFGWSFMIGYYIFFTLLATICAFLFQIKCKEQLNIKESSEVILIH